MKIKQLSKASKEKLSEENKILDFNINKYNSILTDQAFMYKTLKEELIEIEKQFDDDRLTEIAFGVDSTIDEESLIKDETLIVTYTNDNILKSVEEVEYKSQKRGGKGVKATNVKEDETIKFMFTCNSKDDILFFTTEGRCHILKAYKIGKSSKTAKGKSINNYLNLNVGEKVISVLNTNLETNKENNLIFMTKNGIIKKLSLDQLSSRSLVSKVMTFKENDEMIQALLIKDEPIMIYSKNGLSLKIDSKTIRPSGRQAMGVKGMTLTDNNEVIDMCIAKEDDLIISITDDGIGKKTLASAWNITGRGSKGSKGHNLVNNKIVSIIRTTNNKDELFIATKNGLLTRISVKDIRTCGRTSKGVKLINLSDNDSVASVSIKYYEEDKEIINE